VTHKEKVQNTLIAVKALKKNSHIDSEANANAELFGRMIIELEPIKDIFSKRLINMVGDYTRILPGLKKGHISMDTISHLADTLKPQLEDELEKYCKSL